MNFTVETARSEQLKALDYAEEIFNGRLMGYTDALFTGADRRHVLAVTGLPFSVPIANRLMNDELLYPLLQSNETDLLLSLRGNVTFYEGDENYNDKLGCVGCYQYDPVEYRKTSIKKITKEASEHTTDYIMNKLYGEIE